MRFWVHDLRFGQLRVLSRLKAFLEVSVLCIPRKGDILGMTRTNSGNCFIVEVDCLLILVGNLQRCDRRLKPSIFVFSRLKFPEFCFCEAKLQTFLVFPKLTPSFTLLVEIYFGPHSKEKTNIFSEKRKIYDKILVYQQNNKKGVVSYFLKQLTL